MITLNGQEVQGVNIFCWIIPILLFVIGFKDEIKELFIGIWRLFIGIWRWMLEERILQGIIYFLEYIIYFLAYIPAHTAKMFAQGYVSRDIFLVSSIPKVINSFRISFGILPIWIIPRHDYINDFEVELLHRANPLYYEARRAITRSALDQEAKQKLLAQCFLAVQNIANSLWQLFNLRTIMKITGDISVGKKFDNEVKKLEQRILFEMNALVEKLLSISLSLLKSEVAQDNQTIQQMLSDISQSNSRLEKIISPENANYNKVHQNTTTNYLLLFLSLSITFTVISLYTTPYALPIIIVGSLMVFIAISIIQLRKDNTIKDESFVKVLSLIKSYHLEQQRVS
jgi:hypothetical protein